MHYAAINSYSSPTDVGFDNTWYVYAFETKKHRDLFVANASDMATRAIKRNKVITYATNYCMNSNETNSPRPFTTEHWAIVVNDLSMKSVEGFVGEVMCVDDPYSYDYVKRFY